MPLALVVRSSVAGVILGSSLIWGSAGTAHAHGTFTPPVAPRSPVAQTHRGPFSVLHQGPLPTDRGPFSVLHQAP